MVSCSQVSAWALLAVALAVSWVPAGDAVSCFECNSHEDSRCANDAPPESMKKDCSEQKEGQKYTLCRKIVQHIDFEVNGNKPEQRVIRNCGWDNSSYVNKCYHRSGFGGRQEVCTCTTDFCNAAPALPVACAVSLAAISAALCLLAL